MSSGPPPYKVADISTKVEITNELWPRFVTFEQNCA